MAPHEKGLSCEEARAAFSALLDGELRPTARTRLEAHLGDGPEDCTCLAELEGFKRVNQVYAALPPQPAPPGFERRVAAALVRRERWQRLRWIAATRVAPITAAAAGIALIVAPFFWPVRGPEPRLDLAALAEDTAVVPLESSATEAFSAKSFAAEEVAAAAPAPPAADAALQAAPAAAPPPAAPRAMMRGLPAPAAESPDESPRAVGKRTFIYDGTRWAQEGYAGEELQPLHPGDPLWAELQAAEPELELLATLQPPVIFRARDTWYRLASAD